MELPHIHESPKDHQEPVIYEFTNNINLDYTVVVVENLEGIVLSFHLLSIPFSW